MNSKLKRGEERERERVKTHSSKYIWLRIFSILTVFVVGGFLFTGKVEAATYYVRADGTVTAANKANAISSNSADTSLSIAEFNVSTFSPTDIIYFSNKGGVFTSMINIPSGGSSSTNLITYAGEPGYLPTVNGSDTVEILINVTNKQYYEIKDFTLTHALVSGLSIGGTSSGGIIRNIISTYSSNQAFQNLDTASTTYYNITGSNCVDDGFSMHTSSVAVIHGGTFSNNVQGIETINNTDLTTYDVTVLMNSSSVDSYAILVDQNSGSLIQKHTNLTVSGTTLKALIKNDGATLIINGLNLNGTATNSILGYGQNGITNIRNFFVSGPSTHAISSSVGSNSTITMSDGIIDASSMTNHAIDIFGGILNLNNSIIKSIPSTKNAIVARTGTAINLYNNDFFDVDKNGNGVYTIGATSTLKNNIFYTLTTAITNGGSSTTTIDYNLYYNNTTKFNGAITSTHEVINNPDLIDANTGNFNIFSISPAIDSGTTTPNMTSTTTDYLGNPIYGTPDIGAYEYQPPYRIGTDKIETTGNIRIYGDGKYRYTTATSSSVQANLSVTPAEGSWTYAASTTRPEWLNISDIAWGTTKQWTASSSSATTTIYTVGDLTPNTAYVVTVDGATTTAIASTSCSNGNCTSDSDGKLVLTYTGGYSTHTFALTPYIAPTPVTSPTPTPSVSASRSSSGGSAQNRVNNLIAMGFYGEAQKVASQYNIAMPQQAAQAGASSTAASPSPSSFTRTLRYGMTSSDVKRLQIFLNANGFTVSKTGAGSPGHETNYFGGATKSAVIRFQEAYRDAILKPQGLTAGTGLFGEGTRKYVRENY